MAERPGGKAGFIDRLENAECLGNFQKRNMRNHDNPKKRAIRRISRMARFFGADVRKRRLDARCDFSGGSLKGVINKRHFRPVRIEPKEQQRQQNRQIAGVPQRRVTVNKFFTVRYNIR